MLISAPFFLLLATSSSRTLLRSILLFLIMLLLLCIRALALCGFSDGLKNIKVMLFIDFLGIFATEQLTTRVELSSLTMKKYLGRVVQCKSAPSGKTVELLGAKVRGGGVRKKTLLTYLGSRLFHLSQTRVRNRSVKFYRHQVPYISKQRVTRV